MQQAIFFKFLIVSGPIDGVRMCKAVALPCKNTVVIINSRKSDSWKALKLPYDRLWVEIEAQAGVYKVYSCFLSWVYMIDK